MLRSFPRFLLPSTLRGRLIVGVALVHAVMMAVFIIDLTVRQRAALIDYQEQSATALSRSLATSAATWIAANDLAGLQELVESQRTYPEFIFAILTDQHGRVLAHADRSKRNLVLLDLPRAPELTIMSRDSVLVDVAVPAYLGDRHVGWARSGIGQREAGQRLTSTTIDGILYALAAILIGSVIAWMMGNRITRRLYAVQDTINKVKAGEDSTRSHISGSDEAAVLAREFNAMLDRLRERDARLRKSEERFRSLFGDSPIALWEEDLTALQHRLDELTAAGTTDLQGHLDHHPDEVLALAALVRVQCINRRCVEAFGAQDEEQLRGSLPRIIPPESLPAFKEQWIALASGQQRFRSEAPLMNLQGQTMIMDISLAVLPGGDSTLSRVLVSFEDITERKCQERELNQHRQHLEDLVKKRTAALRTAHGEAERLLSILSAILIGIDCNGRIFRFNAAAARSFGRNASEVIGKGFIDSRLLVDESEVTPLMAAAVADQVTREIRDLRCRRQDGVETFLDLSIIPTSSSSCAEHSGIILVGFDVTQRREIEAQRAQGQKLESVGQLAAGVAHEINTPIQFIGDNLQFLRSAFADLEEVVTIAQAVADGLSDPPALVAALDSADNNYLKREVPRAIDQSCCGVTQVASIVRALKDFAHPDSTTKQVVDVNACLLVTATVARNEYKYIADLVTDLTNDLPTILAIPGELNQVFLNLLVNAAQAIAAKEGDSGRKGTITIASRCLGPEIEIRIRDTGTGIPPEHRQRLFTPFFTTKPVGKGTGQGLALCRAFIVKNHGGTISYDSEPGLGTTFTIRLPVPPTIS
jgi:PAS domain S-box-containing protein